MEKRIFYVWLLALMILLSISLQNTLAAANEKPIILKGVTAFPKQNAWNDPVAIFIDAIEKRSKGKIKIDWLGGPEVFGTFDQINALKAGSIDIILWYSFGYLKTMMPEAEAKGLSELAEWEERTTGAFELWTQLFEKSCNAKYLGRFSNCVPFNIFSNVKLEKMADFKGKKIRVMPLFATFIKALGAAPVTLPPTEIYSAMERGVVDGFMFSRLGITSWGWHEVTKYLIEPGVFQTETATMVNLDKWKTIPSDLQNLIMDTMKEYEYIGTMRSLMGIDNEDKVREKAGMKTIRLPVDETKEFKRLAYDTTWEQVLKASPDNGQQLRKLTLKSAIPKGAFRW